MKESFKPRIYQEKIFNSAVRENSLVVLPTGLGKTAIAAMLTQHRLKNYPESKVLFLAPTKPLVEQHLKTFKDLLPEYEEETVLFTGSTPPKKRQELWKTHKIFISTPQGLENDVISRRILLDDVSLIIFDESHRAIGDYAYVFIAKNYAEKGKHARILALTASPGSTQEKILEVAKNLYVDHLEYRTSESEDVKPYTQVVDIQYEFVELPEDFKRVKMFLERCYHSKLKEAVQLGVVEKNIMTLNKSGLISLMSALHGKITKDKSFELLKTISLIAEAMKIQHALELLETQGALQLKEYLNQLKKQAQTTKVRAVKNLVQDINFRSAKILTDNIVEKNIKHPKLIKLEEIVKEKIKDKSNSKIIVFSQFRDSGISIKQVLEANKIKSELFVGQAKKKKTGLSQRQQKEMIEAFENEEFNCLIATSVGEEGLDIPEVDLVLFYEPVPSAIRTVQRRGRTGRQKKGEVITLVTKNTRDEGYKWSSHYKEKRMYKNLEKVKDNIKTMEKETKLKEFDAPALAKNYTIKVDYREKGSKILKELLEMNVNVELTHLEVGDYAVSENVVIEFKTIKDFVDSMIDNRLITQLKELKQYKKPIIMLEGEENIYEQRRIHPNAIRGMISALTLGFGIPMIRTQGPADSAQYIKFLAEREHDIEKQDYQLHSAKPLTDKELQEYIVSSFPGIGTTLAPGLLEEFKTIKNIIDASEEELKKVDLIGKKKSSRLYEIFRKDYES